MSTPDEKVNQVEQPEISFNDSPIPEDLRGLTPNYRVPSKVIWLPNDTWDSLTWGEDDAQAFTDAAADYFDDDTPPPIHGDSIAGRDSQDKIIVFKLLLPNTQNFHGQKEAPNW